MHVCTPSIIQWEKQIRVDDANDDQQHRPYEPARALECRDSQCKELYVPYARIMALLLVLMSALPTKWLA